MVGARRYRASKLAEKPSIPARIVNLSDSAALELQIIENLHRADVHELDEAFGYKALMEKNPDLYTVEVIGTKVGKSPAHPPWSLPFLSRARRTSARSMLHN